MPCAKLCRPFFVYTYFLFVVYPLPYAFVIPPSYRKLRNMSYLYAINYSKSQAILNKHISKRCSATEQNSRTTTSHVRRLAQLHEGWEIDNGEGTNLV